MCDCYLFALPLITNKTSLCARLLWLFVVVGLPCQRRLTSRLCFVALARVHVLSPFRLLSFSSAQALKLSIVLSKWPVLHQELALGAALSSFTHKPQARCPFRSLATTKRRPLALLDSAWRRRREFATRAENTKPQSPLTSSLESLKFEVGGACSLLPHLSGGAQFGHHLASQPDRQADTRAGQLIRLVQASE